VATAWPNDRMRRLIMARMRSGFAVIGDTQHLPGYSVLIVDDPSVSHLTDLDWTRRRHFLFDLALLGEAVERTCRPNGLRRINYEVLGNSWAVLHGHIHARYDWEPPEMVTGPVWRYPEEVRNDPAHAYSDGRHADLRAAITGELDELTRGAY
jgi:diadenosine tetraphosphate (Ap4A) HIT family hydrolase